MGHDVRWCKNRTEIEANEPWADVSLFCHKSFPVRWPNLKPIWEKRTSIWVQWWFDLICTDPAKPVAEQIYVNQYAPHLLAMDLVFVKEREHLDAYRAIGIPAEYLDQGCPTGPRIDETEPLSWDVLVWGQSGPHYKQRRRDVETLLAAGLSVAWAGYDPAHVPPTGCHLIGHVPPEDIHEIASEAACVLCVDRRCDIDGYWSDRAWMALGAGCPCVIRRTGGLPSQHIPAMVYNSPAGLVAFAKALSERTDSRRNTLSRNIGGNARTWAQDHHTIRHRCQQLLERVNSEFGPTARRAAGQGF